MYERERASTAPSETTSERTASTGARERATLASSPAAAGRLVIPGAQARLEVGASDDPAEREADAVADQIVQRLLAQRSGGIRTPGDAVDGGDAAGGRVRRAASAGPVPLARRIRRRSGDGPAPVGPDGGAVDPSVERRLDAARGGGRGLEPAVRREMEDSFGTDLGDVRIHTGAESAALNHDVGAVAFTLGNDIFFDGAAPDTSTAGGQRLLAHELTHVVQQQGQVSRRATRPAEGAAGPGSRDDRKRFSPGPKNPKYDGRRPAPEVGEDEEAELQGEELAARELARQIRRRLRRRHVHRKRKDDVRAVIRRVDVKGAVAQLEQQVQVQGPAPAKAPSVAPPAPTPATAVAMVVGENTRDTATGAYGAVDTEFIEPEITAVRSGSTWYCQVTKLDGTYGKITTPLPAGLKEVTGPAHKKTRQQIVDLLALDGQEFYMSSAVDAHESIHEAHIGPALATVAPELQRLFGALSVPSSDSVKDRASAIAAIKALPGYVALTRPNKRTQSQIRAIWDAQYVTNIDRDHFGPTQRAEADVVEPMIDTLNAYRVSKGWAAIPKTWTCTDGDDNLLVPPGRANP